MGAFVSSLKSEISTQPCNDAEHEDEWDDNLYSCVTPRVSLDGGDLVLPIYNEEAIERDDQEVALDVWMVEHMIAGLP